MDKDTSISLITGRITDEYKKHPKLNWSRIAAGKIYTEWSEYYSGLCQSENLKRIQELEFTCNQYEISIVKNYKEIVADKDKRIQELEAEIERLKQLLTQSVLKENGQLAYSNYLIKLLDNSTFILSCGLDKLRDDPAAEKHVDEIKQAIKKHWELNPL